MTAVGADPGPGVGPGHPWWHPGHAVDRAGSARRDVERFLARQPLARAGTAVPRTARWMARNARRAEDALPGVPRIRPTASMVAHVAMDESIMAVAVSPNRYPSRAEFERVGGELRLAHQVMTDRGWIDDPLSYHGTPPPLADPATSRGWALGSAYERLWWPSGYEPPPGVPGRDRWLGYTANRTASAWVLRHRDGPRPWVVCIHGFGTGTVFMDLAGFRAAWLHRELGVNVAGIVMPVHGSRRPSRFSGEAFLGYDLMNTVHGLAQAVWDVRSLISWVRSQDATAVGCLGVSLGGYTTALVAALEPDLDLAMAGIPVADLVDLFRHHSPRHIHLRAVEHHVLGPAADRVHRVVSPLAVPPAVPHRARAIFAGLGDRLAPVEQAQRLWRHWDEPETCWFPGNHVGYLWSDKVWRFVERVFTERHLRA